MTLRRRLAKLEAIRKPVAEEPRLMIFKETWRDDAGDLVSIANRAKVLTATGWQSIQRRNDEPEAEFLLRAKGFAGDPAARSAWVLAVLRRKHAALDPLQSESIRDALGEG